MYKDKEKEKAYKQAWYKENKERIKERKVILYQINREQNLEKGRLYREANREELKERERLRLEYKREWKAKNPDRVRGYVYKDYKKKWNDEHKEQIKSQQRAWHLRNTYQMTQEDYILMCEDQNGKCAICKEESKLVIDHDHKTGSIRGLLCQSCNKALGGFKDNVLLLTAAIDYLNRE